VDELDLQFAQHVTYVGPKSPEEKPMRTSTRPNENDNHTRSDEPEIEGVVSQVPPTTEGEGNIVSNTRQGNIQNQEVLPVGGVPRHPRASEVSQATSLMEGPPHGVQLADPQDDHGVQTCKEKEENTTYHIHADRESSHESSSEYTWGATNYLPEPTWGRQHGARSEVTRQEELRMWEETNVNKLYQYNACLTCGVSILKLKGTPPITCKECEALEGDKLNDKESSVNTKHGYEQQGRDDEEEYSRVPIAGENDSDYDIDEDLYDGTYSQESDESEKGTINKTATNYVAYAIAPNIPGKVAVKTRTKTVTLHNRYDPLKTDIQVG
jgi:hypothetical protein